MRRAKGGLEPPPHTHTHAAAVPSDLYPVGERGVEQVPGLRVDQSFGLPRASRCVQQEEDVLALHGNGLARRVLLQQLLQEGGAVKNRGSMGVWGGGVGGTSPHLRLLTSSRATSLAAMATGFSVLAATKTCRTPGQLRTASSTVFFSSTSFPPLTPWFTVITVLDWAGRHTSTLG